jgi:hypothetical protein
LRGRRPRYRARSPARDRRGGAARARRRRRHPGHFGRRLGRRLRSRSRRHSRPRGSRSRSGK